MQQTLMNFQERRLQVFEAQANAVAADSAASQACDAAEAQGGEGHAERSCPSSTDGGREDMDMLEHLQQLVAAVQTQQYQIDDLRGKIEYGDNNTSDELYLQQSQSQLRYEIGLRDQRIYELEATLEERERQLDMIPDAVDSILRSPTRPMSAQIPTFSISGSRNGAVASPHRSSDSAAESPYTMAVAQPRLYTDSQRRCH